MHKYAANAHHSEGNPLAMVCHRCNASFVDKALAAGEYLRCSRCHTQLKSYSDGNNFHPLWAFSSAGLICLMLANTNPIMHFEVAGKSQQNFVITGINSLWDDGFNIIAGLVFLCTIAAPFAYLSALCYIGASCTLHAKWPLLGVATKTATVLENFNLLPIFAVACFISVVKLQTIGTVTWDIGALWIAIASLFSMLTAQAHNSGQIANHLKKLQ